MQKELEQKEINQTINFHCGCGGGGTGVAPTIGENGNWFIGKEDTGVKAQGKDGKSAYGVAVEDGFTGTVEEWLESLKGAAGEAGAKGEKGDPGVPGVPGAQGPTGAQGPSGSFANMDVLFEGEITDIGEYNLVHPMADYKMLIFETYVKTPDGHKWRGRDFVFTQPFDYVSNQGARYYVDSALHNDSGAHYFALHLIFHEKSIEVATKLLISPIHKGIAICRIYGIK